MQIDLNNEQLNAVVSSAIVQALSADQRERLIREAIASLLRPTSQYQKESPIQSAFNNAVCRMAQEMLTKQLEEDETVKGQIRSLITDAVQKTLTTNREKVVDDMASSLANYLTRDRY